MITRLLAASAIVLLLAPPALADASCMQMNQLYSWDTINRKTLTVQDYAHHTFKVNLVSECANLRFNTKIGFKSQSLSNLACLKHGDFVIGRANGIPFSCMIASVEPYTPPAKGK